MKETRSEASAALRALAGGRLATSRSFRLHRRRGVFCASGYCAQCGPGPACLVESAPLAGADPLRPLGMIGEPLPPWFYQKIPLRPSWIGWLSALRRLSRAEALPAHPPPPARPAAEMSCRTLVVGGGRSGRLAASALRAKGREVLMVERGASDGMEGVEVAAVYPDRVALAVRDGAPIRIRFEELVIATGGYDRLVCVPGNDLPGVLGARGFERAVSSVPSGYRIGVYGAAVETARVLAAAEAASVEIAFLAGPGPLPDWAGVRLPGTTLDRVRGRRRVRGAMLGGTRLDCDLLVVGFTQPTYELQLQAGMAAGFEGDPPVIVTRGPTRFPTLVVGGARGADAGASVAELVDAWLAGEETDPPRGVLSGGAGPPGTAFVCLCEDVRVRDLTAALAGGYSEVELLKRRTGLGTGPCQGKLCLPMAAEVMTAHGFAPALPTNRPPVRPVTLGALRDHG